MFMYVQLKQHLFDQVFQKKSEQELHRFSLFPYQYIYIFKFKALSENNAIQ